ncbi:FAD-dependent monooxygenase [Parapedobacter sp. 10938]|uniref:FAD-dependent monooxygenase n=1 Tax=Parapedobacter flavus TaxID=3110225 RepID=UPI002DBB8E81|nr:FAD-dependent monooxygenase [Parapedobacter sp. 10938]MEC3881556.1 FAD-dependent monooxygenase [Parapedobacter sp. 10938]
MEAVRHTDVLIIGAGPSGLMMAAQLLRYGIQPTIIDAKSGPDRETKATLVHARSMELFRQLGLSDHLLAKGLSLYAVQLFGRKAEIGTLDFSQLLATDTVFPFIERVGQDSMERLLLNRLTERACPVAWETRLDSLRLDDGGATVTLVHGGERQAWRCAWLIGADGQHSSVREQLNIPLEGDGRVRNFFAADVETDQADARKIKLILYDNGPLAVVPSGVADRYRIIGQLPGAHNSPQGSTLRYTDIKKEVRAALGVDLPGAQYLRITPFSYRKMVAEQVRRQRCFLLGDAAHGVLPTVSRGMNEGLYDAANLAWKLAGVVNGRMAPNVLDTYQQERMPAIKADGGIFELGEKGWIWRGLLDRVGLLRRISRIDTDPAGLRRAFDRLSGLDVDYRRSPLSVHHASGGQIQAGDRLPCLSVYDEKSKTHTDLHRWCEKPGFVLLVLGTISHHHLNIIGQWMRQKYPREMHLYYLPYSDRNQQVFQAFEVKTSNTKIVLIRPDMYIAYINDMLNVSLIDTYMEEILGWAGFGHLPEKH